MQTVLYGMFSHALEKAEKHEIKKRNDKAEYRILIILLLVPRQTKSYEMWSLFERLQNLLVLLFSQSELFAKSNYFDICDMKMFGL